MPRTSRRAPPSTAVPSTESLRQRALSDSWRRGRRIARGRLAMRWLFWCLTNPRTWLALLAVGCLAFGAGWYR